MRYLSVCESGVSRCKLCLAVATLYRSECSSVVDRNLRLAVGLSHLSTVGPAEAARGFRDAASYETA